MGCCCLPLDHWRTWERVRLSSLRGRKWEALIIKGFHVNALCVMVGEGLWLFSMQASQLTHVLCSNVCWWQELIAGVCASLSPSVPLSPPSYTSLPLPLSLYWFSVSVSVSLCLSLCLSVSLSLLSKDYPNTKCVIWWLSEPWLVHFVMQCLYNAPSFNFVC